MREYNDEKYAALMGTSTMQEALMRYWGDPDETITCSRHNELFEMKRTEAHAMRNRLTLDSLRPFIERAGCIVELGAGFGQTAHFIAHEFPALRYVAGEFTPNGIALGKKLLPMVEFVHFDFFDDAWEIFNDVTNALVLTVHSVEMMPDANVFVQKIKHHAAQIHHVVNFEPIHEDGDTELSRKRRAYIDENGYCKNILDIPYATIEKDFFGLNPLFPESRLEWKP